ncbi:hypothetical protein [Nonlabens ulvanivorans]|uniref:Uncharacterized protein n=1 Tax=Nonlabens ulvanivorans TaxID=906888 RepID=A0A084JX51_NONUL|nr:hypothetical protein [Nonlabens ulvanivorans]KEZ93535.1 hypothetical protein IL45_04810 [Nonlabens ulvanivorans]PRX14111.1 hypothetical protein LY02_01140 [Nonlabens ulvanivorans]WOI23327.1 hypothetical protein R1T42_02520 [Nonlabens ulvanivorans]GAK99674.1 hypothetical protein JCM19314_3719 [Nonlabens ulvanivorans]|tara:strand:- start:832 stop:1164 length:333 start_codon:yes stop_codon:yes gene_type:complete
MSENTIPLEQAQQWRSNWKASGKEWIQAQTDGLQGFLVPGSDLSQVTGENGVDCRIYLGLTEPGTGGVAKVMLVAVGSDGKDLIDAENGYYIYDNSSSIPPNGDSSSPLN